MRLRTTFIASMVILVSGLLIIIVGRVAIVLQDTARLEVSDDLNRSREIFENARVYRQSLYASEGRVVAEEPRLKAVVATEDVSQETVYGVAYDLRKALQSDLFLMTDGEGRLLADVLDPKAFGFDLRGNAIVAKAIAEGEQAGVWTSEGAVFEVFAKRLMFGTTAVGVLVVGFKVNDQIASNIQKQAGSITIVMLDGKIIASSNREDGTELNRESAEKELSSLSVSNTSENSLNPVELTIGGERYLGLISPFPSYAGESKLRYAVLRSLDRAMLPSYRVSNILYRIAALGLLASVILAIALSVALSRSLDRLVVFVKSIGAGELKTRVSEKGPSEIRTLAKAMNWMVAELDESRAQMAAKERLEQELEISARIQTSILPRSFDAGELGIAARMVPATEVGGDYYDVFYGAAPKGRSKRAALEWPPRGAPLWIGIGDVAGHGLRSGLIMLMVQSVVSALGRANPKALPSDIVRALNMVLYENIRHRLGHDEHATFTMMRYEGAGRFVFAGAHEEILVCRANAEGFETIPTEGPWVGAVHDVGTTAVNAELLLNDGDLMILYTDGITEARNAAGDQFGLERLANEILARRAQPLEQMIEAVFQAVASFSPHQDDDRTLLVIHYRSQATSRDEAGANLKTG